MYIRLNKTNSLLIMGFLFSLIFALYDTSPYLDASAEVSSEFFINQLQQENKNVHSDFLSADICKKINEIDSQFHSDGLGLRICMLDAMPEIKSVSGTFVFAMLSETWLSSHPDDHDVKTAALQMISNSWKILDEDQKTTVDPLRRLSQAWNQSIILSVFKKVNESETHKYDALRLEQIEQRINSFDERSK